MRIKFLGAAALVAALGVILLPGAALPVAEIHEHEGLADYDSRTGKVAPTSAQRAHARRLVGNARVRWNRFGTPSSIVRHGKFLARGIRGKNAAVAARWYLNRHRALFGLQSLDGLVLESSNRLVGSNGYAVNFRQVFKGTPTSESGLVTVGVVGSKARGWRVAQVSSSLTRATTLAGVVKLSATDGWARAARASRMTRSVVNILTRKRMGGVTRLRVAGLDSPQTVRLVAFPTVREGLLPAYEALVVDGKAGKAYRSYVDARNGRLLARQNLVHNAASGLRLTAVTVTPFSGTLPTADAGCVTHAPFTVGAGVRAVSGFVTSTNPATDLVFELYRVGPPDVLLIHADGGFQPEGFRYAPAGGVPPGSYYVKVCDFPGGGGPPEPRTYNGTITIDDTPAPPAYWAKWETFPAHPNPGPFSLQTDPWGRPALDIRETWCWRDATGCDKVVGNLLSRAPWDHDLVTDLPTFTTVGNNAEAASNWAHQSAPVPPRFSPTSPLRDYSYPWTDTWNQSDCTGAGPTAVHGVSLDVSAAVTNLFVAHNRMHDWAYGLGFNEVNWNGQKRNFGLTEAWQQGDPVTGNAQAGAGLTTAQAFAAPARNNANMATLTDGLSSITNMYLWQPQAGSFYPPCADGDYDMPIIGHEYGHMIENRMIGKGLTRQGGHAGMMGESHADLFAMEYINENGFAPVAGENRYAVGAYATGNQSRAIRNYGMNFPTSGGSPQPSKQLNINTLNFGAMGYDVTGPQVHADGEIFSRTNFTVRELLNDKYDDDYPSDDQELQTECAEGLVPAHRCPGNRRWMQLVFDGFLLMPVNPTMLQARDAVLSADLMRFGGANQKELWLGYARSGMGVGASVTSENDFDPVPDFEPVGTSPATVRFSARSKDGDPVNARIFVGHYEGRASPIADTNPATVPGAINLDDTAKFAPGTYEFVAVAPGYGHVRFSERFRSGEHEKIKLKFARNWASSASGATVTGDDQAPPVGPASLANLIDDTEGTVWTAVAANFTGTPTPGVPGGNLSVDGKQATVDLGGTDDVRVRYIQVSAHIGPGHSRFSALRQFELWACNSQRGGNCSTPAGFSRVYTSPHDAFPGDPPRPVAPHLILRRFDVPDFKATHVKLVVKTNQCTGAPSFQGDQDADPANNPDCDTNVPGNSARNFVRAAELQVFSHRPDNND
jgi:extracellular elastinolytic metalloproteinase